MVKPRQSASALGILFRVDNDYGLEWWQIKIRIVTTSIYPMGIVTDQNKPDIHDQCGVEDKTYFMREPRLAVDH